MSMSTPILDHELVTALKRLRLGRIAETLPERLVLADKQQMTFDNLLLLVRVRPPERTWAGGGQACLDCPAEECAAVERELAPASSQPAAPRPVAQALRRAEADLCPGTLGFEDAVLNMRFARDRVDRRRSIPERALAIHGLTRRTSVSPIVVRGRRRRESSRQRRSSMCSTCVSLATALPDDGQSQNEL